MALERLVQDLRVERTSAVAWFEPSFHEACGVVVPPADLVRLVTYVRGGGEGPIYRWLSPATSCEEVRLPAAETVQLRDAIERATEEAARDPGRGMVIDGCVYALRTTADARVLDARGNLGAPTRPRARALARLVCDVAEEHGRWTSTRTAFSDLRRYLQANG